MTISVICSFFFFFNDTATTEIYTLSLHDALPISAGCPACRCRCRRSRARTTNTAPNCSSASLPRSEEHTSELQSPDHLVCRLLLEKKKNKKKQTIVEIYTSYSPQRGNRTIEKQ